MPEIDDDIAKKYDLRTNAGKQSALEEQIQKDEEKKEARSFQWVMIGVIVFIFSGITLWVNFDYYIIGNKSIESEYGSMIMGWIGCILTSVVFLFTSCYLFLVQLRATIGLVAVMIIATLILKFFFGD